MKKQNLTKFALSLVCAAVLSACGGSGSDAPTTTAPVVSEAEQKIQALLAAAQKENTDAKLELNEAQLKEFANKFGATIDATNAAAVKEALAKFKADQTKPATSGDIDYTIDASKAAFTNLQIARNNKSNLGQTKLSDKVTATISFSQADQPLHRSLDTIVVATPANSRDTGVTAYLEDFHFDSSVTDASKLDEEIMKVGGGAIGLTLLPLNLSVGQKTSIQEAKTESSKQLKDLVDKQKTADEDFAKNPTDETKKTLALSHKAAVELYKLSDAIVQAAKDTDTVSDVVEKANGVVADDSGNITQTAKDALKAADLFPIKFGGRDKETYERTGIYVAEATKDTGDKRAAGRATNTETSTVGKSKGNVLRYQDARRVYITADDDKVKTAYVDISGAANSVRVLNDSVAEVYGNKTFTYEINADNKSTYNRVNDEGVNLPLFEKNEKDGSFKGGYLSRVQYGRVTTALNDVKLDDLKDGALDNTKVVAYGKFGTDGTENHYFARGTDNITAGNFEKLGNTGTLTYNGHAVSYGLDNSHNNRDKGVPNAIGASYLLHSGNHVTATLDLVSKDVKGSIYNYWTTGEKDAKGNLSLTPVELVKFSGQANNLGNITGTAQLAYKDSKGTFAAALYGQAAEELGGAVQSHDYKDGAWGAVFGAQKVEAAKAEAVQEGSPLNPRNQSTNN